MRCLHSTTHDSKTRKGFLKNTRLTTLHVYLKPDNQGNKKLNFVFILLLACAKPDARRGNLGACESTGGYAGYSMLCVT